MHWNTLQREFQTVFSRKGVSECALSHFYMNGTSYQFETFTPGHYLCLLCLVEALFLIFECGRNRAHLCRRKNGFKIEKWTFLAIYFFWRRLKKIGLLQDTGQVKSKIVWNFRVSAMCRSYRSVAPQIGTFRWHILLKIDPPSMKKKIFIFYSFYI